jgi:precorrin-4 C11-methyltransferase
MKAIITHSDKGEELARKIVDLNFEAQIYRSPKNYNVLWEKNDTLIFIGALGICVRAIAPFLSNKKTDPAILNIDTNGQFVQSVASGHLGGGNNLTNQLAQLLEATAIITTVSDNSNLWALDLLPKKFNWELEHTPVLTHLMATFVNKKRVALLLEIRDKGTLFLETTAPKHVTIFYNANDIAISNFDLIIAVTPFIYNFSKKAIYYRPKVLHIGLGAQKNLPFAEFEEKLLAEFSSKNISPKSIKSAATVDIKKDEPAFLQLARKWNIDLEIIDSKVLATYKTPNPSEIVKTKTGSYSVSEAAAIHIAANKLLVEKTKVKAGDKYFTYTVAFNKTFKRKGFVEFVGAGPGDPELISVRGKKLLQTADLILYAGSLIPQELTHYAKPGCVVKSSAGMDLQTQIETMKLFYNRKLFIVRLHTGDPSIYGAIQEQMTVMDELNWQYHITPGISSFQAAAAALKSQFTIPEEVQTIILTRGEGRTPMPDKEQLHKLAASQSTMCIFLSASMAKKIETDLLQHYPPETPVAVCHKLTWKEEQIFRCTVASLAKTVTENNLKMTTLIVVGKAIDNRSGTSKLYHKEFTHAFRKGKEQ